MDEIKNKIKLLAKKYREELHLKFIDRVRDMKTDDNSHYLIYKVLGISVHEGEKIDIYQNKGRFLYKYAGSFLEEATILCFESKFPNAQKKVMIENTEGKKPKKFEIDCLIENYAYEIKWRDATTDGDHITKEHTRIITIKNAGFIPVRIMFFFPNRDQAIRIQKTLQTLYLGIEGEYYFGDTAWKYIKEKTNIDLFAILEEMAEEVENE
ncbi:MAG: ApaLI family restriction endonuclease [Clostridia bacterium]